MNTVTPEQREVLRERDSQVGLPVSPKGESEVSVSEGEAPVRSEVEGRVGEITDYEWELARLEFERDTSEWRRWYQKHVNCLSVVGGGECGEYVQQPSMGSYTGKYEL